MAGVLTTEEVASLYRRHAGMVYQISRMLLKNGPDAEDAVQTVFRKAMEREELSPRREEAILADLLREKKGGFQHEAGKQTQDSGGGPCGGCVGGSPGRDGSGNGRVRHGVGGAAARQHIRCRWK